MNYGQNLIALRGDRPAQEVAAAVGITIASLLAYETNRRIPRDTVKLALANFYGLALEVLFPVHTNIEEVTQ